MMHEADSIFGSMTRFQQADITGLSPSTVAKHLKKITRDPRSTSLVMWARALGGRIVFVKDE